MRHIFHGFLFTAIAYLTHLVFSALTAIATMSAVETVGSLNGTFTTYLIGGLIIAIVSAVASRHAAKKGDIK